MLMSGTIGRGFGMKRRRNITGTAPTPTPTPAPSFSVQPSITDDGTPQVGETLTGNDGTIANGAVSARQWLLNGSAISGATGASYVPDAEGSLTYRVTATGAGGSTQATSAAVTVAAASTPTPTPTPSGPTVLVNSTATEPVLIDTITTHTGDWPVHHLLDTGDLRVYRWSYSEDPTWWAVSVNRLPDPALTEFNETLLTVTVDGVDHPVRVLQGSTKFIESHVPVTPSLAAVAQAVADMELPVIDGARFTMFPNAVSLAPTILTMGALGYKPDRIYGRDAIYNNAIGNVSSGTGENHSSRAFMADNESVLIAAALGNNQTVFDDTAAAIHNEILWAMSMPHFMPWSPNHHYLRDPQIPFSGDLAYTSGGIAPPGGEAIGSGQKWTAPADYPYLAEINATAGTQYSHLRDTAHLFNHGWAYWFATGDPRVALVQNAIATTAIGSEMPNGTGNYACRFSAQRLTMNKFSAAYKVHAMQVTSSAVIWPQTRRTKFYNDHYADWQAKIALMDDPGAADVDKRRAAFKLADSNPTNTSYYMYQQYGALPAYFHAKEGKPDLLKRLAEHFIIRVNEIGGRRGLQNDTANSNNGGDGSNLFDITTVVATTKAGMIAEIFDPRTSLSTTNFDGGSSGGACYIYMVLKFAQDAVARGWMAPVTGLDLAVTNFEAQHGATTLTTLAHRTITSWRHMAVPFA